VNDDSLIVQPESITPQWTQAVLSAGGYDSAVADVSVSAVGTGLMGRSYRVEIDAQGEAPPSIVVKFASADPFTRSLGASSYARELGFYRDLAARVEATVPVCHYGEISADHEDFVLVLEDITPAEQGDQLQGTSIERAVEALANMARLHASTWADVSILEYPWVQPSADVPLGALLSIALGAFGERFGSLVDDSVLSSFGTFAEHADRWTDSQPQARAAVHGDFRLDNLLFSSLDQRVTIVDWQTVDFLNPGRDLAYFLGNSLTVEDRRDAEGDLVSGYVDELVRSGVTNYGLEDAMYDMRSGTFQGPLVTMLGAFVAAKTDRSDRMFAAMAARSAAQIADHDALDLIT